MDIIKKLAAQCPTLFPDGAESCEVSTPQGWDALVLDLSVRLEAHAREHSRALRVVQIKSKFGGLRYYVEPYDPRAEALIHETEMLSAKTCETCGKPGERTGRGWIVTACPEHSRSK